MERLLPQGENVEHPTKFPHKERFYQQLANLLATQHSPEEHLAVMGDFNISPEDQDIGIGEANRKRWLRDGKASFQPIEREWLAGIKAWGLSDSYRLCHPDNSEWFSWFDYRSKGFDREPKRGLRIDYILVSPLWHSGSLMQVSTIPCAPWSDLRITRPPERLFADTGGLTCARLPPTRAARLIP